MLGLSTNDVLGNYITVPGNSPLREGKDRATENGKSHGRNQGKFFGEYALAQIEKSKEEKRRSKKIKEIWGEFIRLRDDRIAAAGDNKKKARIGLEFEALWRDLLNSQGCEAESITIDGEQNDFTAVLEGQHILGEVKWLDKKVGGPDINKLIGKMGPRPNSVGMLVSMSGVKKKAFAVINRNRGGRTILVFEKEDIEKAMKDPSSVKEMFRQKLREAYDEILIKT